MVLIILNVTSSRETRSFVWKIYKILVFSGSIVESKGMRAIFQKKGQKMFKNL